MRTASFDEEEIFGGVINLSLPPKSTLGRTQKINAGSELLPENRLRELLCFGARGERGENNDERIWHSVKRGLAVGQGSPEAALTISKRHVAFAGKPPQTHQEKIPILPRVSDEFVESGGSPFVKIMPDIARRDSDLCNHETSLS